MSDNENVPGELPDDGSLDIGPVLDGWEPKGDEIVARRIRGADGTEKIQMRIALGIVQMNAEGHPSGARPMGHESLLEYHLARLREHRTLYGKDEGFRINPKECEALGEESYAYYYRYLCQFQLRDFEAVARDTGRNLQVLDFIRAYAAAESDRFALERYRPYIVMMNARARAYLALDASDSKKALHIVQRAAEMIRGFYREAGGRLDALDPEELIGSSMELQILDELKEQIGGLRQGEAPQPEPSIPKEPNPGAEALLERMRQAVAQENFELAAELRDEIKAFRDRAERESGG
jgi:hypothetical protein